MSSNLNDSDETTQVHRMVPASLSGTRALPKDRALVTVVSGPTRGACFRVGPSTVLGRGQDADIALHDPTLSRKHARIYQEGIHFFIEDLGSTNGTYVGGSRVERPQRLADGDRIQLSRDVVVKFAQLDRMEETETLDLHESALRDPLTQVYNRAVLNDRLAAEWAYAERHKEPLSVIMIDVDHFKRFNDTHGHQAGDAILRVVAASVARVIRREDLLARYGGEEFAAVARGISYRNCEIMAERIRRRVELLRVPWKGKELSLTVSLGGATYDGAGSHRSAEDLLAAADQALGDAKTGGRNRVVMASHR